MIELLQFTLITLTIAMLFSVPGILLGYWLKKKQLAPNRSLLTIIFCVVLVFVQRIWLPNLPFYWLALVLLVGSTLGVYRMDLYWATSKKSRE